MSMTLYPNTGTPCIFPMTVVSNCTETYAQFFAVEFDAISGFFAVTAVILFVAYARRLYSLNRDQQHNPNLKTYRYIYKYNLMLLLSSFIISIDFHGYRGWFHPFIVDGLDVFGGIITLIMAVEVVQKWITIVSHRRITITWNQRIDHSLQIVKKISVILLSLSFIIRPLHRLFGYGEFSSYLIFLIILELLSCVAVCCGARVAFLLVTQKRSIILSLARRTAASSVSRRSAVNHSTPHTKLNVLNEPNIVVEMSTSQATKELEDLDVLYKRTLCQTTIIFGFMPLIGLILVPPPFEIHQ